MDKTAKIVRAAKVILLDEYNRAYLRHNDPKAFEQLKEAVREYEPDIDDQISHADDMVKWRNNFNPDSARLAYFLALGSR